MAKADGKITQSDAIREALRAGVEAPAEGVKWIKATHGLDVTTNMFSAIKSAEKAGASKAIKVPSASGKAPVASKSKAVPSNSTAVKLPSKPATPIKPASGAAHLAQSVKRLIEEYGAEEVRGMVAVLSE